MRFFSLDSLTYLFSLILATSPLLACWLEKRTLTVPETIGIFIGILLAGFTLYSSSETSKKLTKLDDRIASFQATLTMNFSWPIGQNPLLDNENDSGTGVEEFIWLNSNSSQISLFSEQGYTLVRTGPSSAQFRAFLTPKGASSPVGKNADVVWEIVEYSVFPFFKNYHPKSRDNYAVTVENYNLTIQINDRTGTIKSNIPRSVQPVNIDNSIAGRIIVLGKIDGGLRKVFEDN